MKLSVKAAVVAICIGLPIAGHAENWVAAYTYAANDATRPNDIVYADTDSVSKKGEIAKVRVNISMDPATTRVDTFDCVRNLYRPSGQKLTSIAETQSAEKALFELACNSSFFRFW